MAGGISPVVMDGKRCSITPGGDSLQHSLETANCIPLSRLKSAHSPNDPICCTSSLLNRFPSFAAAAAVSTSRRHLALLLHGEEERPGHPLRVHGPAAHQQRHGRAEGQVSGHLLSEAEAQQPAQAAWVRLLGARHQAPDDSQQQLVGHAGGGTQLDR